MSQQGMKWEMAGPSGQNSVAQRDLDNSSDIVFRVASLYERYASRFFRYFQKHVRVFEDAEDLNNRLFGVEVLIQLRRGNEPRAHEGAWLMGIARHMLADYYRRGPGGEPQMDSLELINAREADMDNVDTEWAPSRAARMLDIEMAAPTHSSNIDDAEVIWRQLTPSHRRAFFYRHVMNLRAADLMRVGCRWTPSYYYRVVSEANARVQTLRGQLIDNKYSN